jgi:hypothetical protein
MKKYSLTYTAAFTVFANFVLAGCTHTADTTSPTSTALESEALKMSDYLGSVNMASEALLCERGTNFNTDKDAQDIYIWRGEQVTAKEFKRRCDVLQKWQPKLHDSNSHLTEMLQAYKAEHDNNDIRIKLEQTLRESNLIYNALMIELYGLK